LVTVGDLPLRVGDLPLRVGAKWRVPALRTLSMRSLPMLSDLWLFVDTGSDTSAS
jgi:hypothetical protein